MSDGIDNAIGKRGPFMCRIASRFLLHRLKGSMSSDARDFNNIETQAVIKFPSPQGKAPKEIRAILTETLGKHAPSYAVTNWVAQFKRGDFVHLWCASSWTTPSYKLIDILLIIGNITRMLHLKIIPRILCGWTPWRVPSLHSCSMTCNTCGGYRTLHRYNSTA